MGVKNEIQILYNVVNDDRYIHTYNQNKYKNITSTIHSAKGLEYEQVIIIGNDYNFSDEEDRYLHYVAVSRPKNRLLILVKDDLRGGEYFNELNRVIKETNNIGFEIESKNVIRRVKAQGL